MSHTIHRFGRPEDLLNDYTIIFLSAKGINSKGSQEKIKTFLRLCEKHHAANFGNMEAGSKVVIGTQKVIDAVKDGTTVTALFNDQNDVVNILNDLVELDLGMSVILQGLEHKVKECCARASLTPHTWNHSFGIWGKKELLPEADILEITTMCGHGLIAVALVKKIVADLKNEKITMQRAVEKLVKPCICGIVNPSRLENILAKMLKTQSEKSNV